MFHTLDGLRKEEFRGFRTTIHTRGGTFTFDELVTMLNAESITNTKVSSLDSVFLTTSKTVTVPSVFEVATFVNMYRRTSLSST